MRMCTTSRAKCVTSESLLLLVKGEPMRYSGRYDQSQVKQKSMINGNKNERGGIVGSNDVTAKNAEV